MSMCTYTDDCFGLHAMATAFCVKDGISSQCVSVEMLWELSLLLLLFFLYRSFFPPLLCLTASCVIPPPPAAIKGERGPFIHAFRQSAEQRKDRGRREEKQNEMEEEKASSLC